MTSRPSPGLPDGRLAFVRREPQIRERLISQAGGLALPLERNEVLIELPAPVGNCQAHLLVPLRDLVQLLLLGRQPRPEVVRRFLEAIDLGADRRRAFHQRGVRGPGIGGAPGARLGLLAACGQTRLGRCQPILRRAAVRLHPHNRLPRLALASLDGAELLVSAPAFGLEQTGLAGEAVRLVGRPLHLQVEADDVLLLPVLVGAERRDRPGQLGDNQLRGGGVAVQRGQRLALGGQPVAQLFDLALGGEDAPRLRARPARHEVRSPEHVAVERDNRRRRQRGGLRRLIKRRCDPGLPHRVA